MRMSIAGDFPRSDVFLQSATNRVVLKFLSLHMSYRPGNRLMKLTTKGRGVLRQAARDERGGGGMSSRQGCNPAGGSPAGSIARVGRALNIAIEDQGMLRIPPNWPGVALTHLWLFSNQMDLFSSPQQSQPTKTQHCHCRRLGNKSHNFCTRQRLVVDADVVNLTREQTSRIFGVSTYVDRMS